MVSVDLEDLRTVYEYARHFDVDADPAMQRVRKLIETSTTETSDGPADKR